MISPLIFDIARSLMLARWRQTMVAAIGVTFSITMFIGLLGFMTGLNDLLDGLIINRTAHVRIFNDIQPAEVQPVDAHPLYGQGYNFVRSVKLGNGRSEIFNSSAIMEAVVADPRVSGISARINAQVFFNEGSIDITGVVNGLDAEAEMKLFHFGDYVIQGSPLDIQAIPNSIILGKDLAENLQAVPGNVIQITTPGGERFRLRVVGIYQSGLRDFDKTQSFASISTTQKILGKSSAYLTDIHVKLNDIEQAPAVSREYRKLFGTDTEDIQTANAQFETGSFVRMLIAYAVGITLLIVAGFGIYNILNMMIYEKMDSIAILKATGFSGGDVQRVFIVIALGIGLIGGALGLLFGLGLSLMIDQIPFITAALPTIRTYPVNYSPAFYIIGFSFSLVTTYFAGFFPARKASRVDPVAIIRGK